MGKSGWIDEPLYSKIRASIPIATVDLLVVYKHRLLLMLRNDEPAKNLWFTPGGRILLGESFEEAVRRVLEKETGLTPIKMEKKGVMSHVWSNHHNITIFYHIDVNNDNVKMNEEHEAYKWISKVTNDLHPYIKEMIKEAKILE